MSPLGYRCGRLHLDGTALAELAERFGTPLYVYSAPEIRRRYRRLIAAFGELRPLVCYAMKANPVLGVAAVLAREGAGADVVSAGELERALRAGVPAARVVFAGVGKSRDEIERGLAAEILQFNVESLEELRLVDDVAQARGVRAPVALRLNPDVAAQTLDKISTGRRHDKFGIGAERLDEALDLVGGLAGVRLVGLHCHIGSQIASVADFERAYGRMVGFWAHARERGFRLERLNLGGGLGVRYAHEHDLDIEAFAAMVERLTRAVDAQLAFEPGRYLVAAAGVLVSRVLIIKSGSDARRFAVLDAGMNTLLRPALYGARHLVLPLQEAADGDLETVDLVGPICESSDVFERDVELPPLAAGDLVAFTNAGAYGATMASDYNSRGMAAEILVDDARIDIVKRGRSAAALAADETVPDHLRRGAPVEGGP